MAFSVVVLNIRHHAVVFTTGQFQVSFNMHYMICLHCTSTSGSKTKASLNVCLGFIWNMPDILHFRR